MAKEIDYRVIEATLEAIAPIISANGLDKESIETYVYYLLIIASGFAEESGISKEEFDALCKLLYRVNKKKSN